MISYADSSGGVNILGPKMAEQVVMDFTYDFLKKARVVGWKNNAVIVPEDYSCADWHRKSRLCGS